MSEFLIRDLAFKSSDQESNELHEGNLKYERTGRYIMGDVSSQPQEYSVAPVKVELHEKSEGIRRVKSTSRVLLGMWRVNSDNAVGALFKHEKGKEYSTFELLPVPLQMTRISEGLMGLTPSALVSNIMSRKDQELLETKLISDLIDPSIEYPFNFLRAGILKDEQGIGRVKAAVKEVLDIDYKKGHHVLRLIGDGILENIVRNGFKQSVEDQNALIYDLPHYFRNSTL